MRIVAGYIKSKKEFKKLLKKMKKEYEITTKKNKEMVE